MACPGTGAHPTPEAVGSNILLDLGVSALSSRLGLAKAKGLISAAELVLGSMSVSDLCAINPSDPGPPTIEMLKWDLIEGFLPGLNATQGTLGRWLWDSAVYHFFQISCACNDASTQPPITVVTAPPGSQDYPTDNAHAPQLTRIENNQSSASEGLTTLYNGLAYSMAYSNETWYRTIQGYATHQETLQQWTMSGEGQHNLVGYSFGGNTLQDVYGIVVELTTIPSTVAQRGSLTPRLYGVGSVYWGGGPDDSYFPKTVLQRDSIHYERQFILAPQRTHTYTLYWHLQPGVTATAYQLVRDVDYPIYTPTVPDALATHMAGLTFPPNYSDPPFYPAPAASTFYSLPGPKP